MNRTLYGSVLAMLIAGAVPASAADRLLILQNLPPIRPGEAAFPLPAVTGTALQPPRRWTDGKTGRPGSQAGPKKLKSKRQAAHIEDKYRDVSTILPTYDP